MRIKITSVISFIIGAVVALLLFLGIKSIFEKNEDKVQNDFYLITNQIKKMNKLVVMEQELSSMQKTKMTSELLGGIIPPMEKEIVTFTKTIAQVSYDLNQMKIEVDSIGKKLIIKELPNADIKITPSVEIQTMDDSFFNRFKENDIKRIQNNAKNNAIKQVNEAQLRSKGRVQLLENLNQIFVLAKALNYEIIDETGNIDTTKL